MYNQWALQQVAALQLSAALQQQQQQHQQNLQLNLQHIQNQHPQLPHQQHLQQHLNPQQGTRNSPVPAAHSVSDGDDSDNADDEQNRTLFCANLDDRVTEELLYEVFLQAGPIESVRIPKDNTGRQRTFGFVTYVHACTLPYALRLYQGLSLFRKGLTIKFQGNNSTPSTPQQRRSLPNDCERYNRRSGGSGGSGGSYDNNSLRSGNYEVANDVGGAKINPFRREENSSEWSKGRNNEKERISKHVSGKSRPHQNSAPYQRRSGGSEGGNERGNVHDRLGNDYQRRHQNSGSNRRSEQRSNNNKR